MRIENTMDAANKVLKLLLPKLKKFGSDRLAHAVISAYANGRENGYQIHVTVFDGNKPTAPQLVDTCVMFSENRNSDDIVVYKQNPYSGGIPTDEAYANKKQFICTDVRKAANYIFNTLITPESKEN